jgi:hypothetical protein
MRDVFLNRQSAKLFEPPRRQGAKNDMMIAGGIFPNGGYEWRLLASFASFNDCLAPWRFAVVFLGALGVLAVNKAHA